MAGSFRLAGPVRIRGLFAIGPDGRLYGLLAGLSGLPDRHPDDRIFVIDLSLILQGARELAEVTFIGVHLPVAREVGPVGGGKRDAKAQEWENDQRAAHTR